MKQMENLHLASSEHRPVTSNDVQHVVGKQLQFGKANALKTNSDL